MSDLIVGTARYAGARVHRVEDAATPDRARHVRRRRRSARHAPCVLRPQPRGPGADRLGRRERRARAARRRSGVRRRRHQPRCPRLVVHVDGCCNAGEPEAAVGRGRGPVRRRSRRVDRGRRPVCRGGRRRSRRPRPRPSATGRRLRDREGVRAPRPRGVSRQRGWRDRRHAAGDAVARVRRCTPRGVGNDLPAGLCPGPDGDTRDGCRVGRAERRDDGVGRHPGPPRGADVRRPAPRRARAQRPCDRAGHRWRLWPEGASSTRGHVRPPRRPAGWGCDQVDRGSAGEPARSWAVSP